MGTGRHHDLYARERDVKWKRHRVIVTNHPCMPRFGPFLSDNRCPRTCSPLFNPNNQAHHWGRNIRGGSGRILHQPTSPQLRTQVLFRGRFRRKPYLESLIVAQTMSDYTARTLQRRSCVRAFRQRLSLPYTMNPWHEISDLMEIVFRDKGLSTSDWRHPTSLER